MSINVVVGLGRRARNHRKRDLSKCYDCGCQVLSNIHVKSETAIIDLQKSCRVGSWHKEWHYLLFAHPWFGSLVRCSFHVRNAACVARAAGWSIHKTKQCTHLPTTFFDFHISEHSTRACGFMSTMDCVHVRVDE